MGKPIGIDWTMRDGVPMLGVIRPTPVEDAIWDAIERAVDAGWTVEEFRREAASCWDGYLHDKARSDRDAWRK